ncbi:MAG: deoxyribonuclease V [Pseudomonadota bacterium]|nr:MAG: deoxyribonuclease V [Pseudomonadota bacterium]
MTARLDVAQLQAQQRRLAQQVVRHDDFPDPPRLVAAVDSAFPDAGRTTRAAAVLFRYPQMDLVESRIAEQATSLPYIPGLLSFRELPAVLAALRQLSRPPDIVLCDGQGIAHPRRFGIACHLGVTTGLPTIGVGKSRLCGTHRQPGAGKGKRTALYDGEEIIGVVLRSRERVRPLFVSIGHRVGLDSAVALTLACTTRYRLPEPIRAADRLAGQSVSRCSR